MKKHRLLAAVLSIGMLLTGLSLPTASAAGTRVSVHDPSVIKDEGTYYVFGSHIDAAKSTDLINWRTFTNGYAKTNNVEFGNLSENLAKAFAWAGEDLGDCKGGFSVWAPDVIWNPDFVNADGSTGAYVMYFCTSSDYRTSVISFASAQKIEGPYTFGDTLIYSGFTDTNIYWEGTDRSRRYNNTNIDELIDAGEVTYNNDWFNNHNFNNTMYPNAIDPTIYYDTDGKMYMTYGSWSGGIFTLEVDPKTGYVIHPKTGTTSDGRMVDSYFGTKIAGGYGKSGEGPFIEYNADTGYYYLWTVYGGLFSDGGYNMRVSRSTSPMGPFKDPAGNPAVLSSGTNLDSVGLKVMGNYKFSTLDRAYMACGHNSVLKDDDGQWYLLYHARFDDGSEYHEVRVHSMWFNEDGWPVVAPFEYAGDKMEPGGYETSDITGTYEYINHGNATNGTIINYTNITLNADGTISGSSTGTWKQAEDSAAATLVIDGKTYKGYFLAARNEKGKTVMSFTAVGTNNQTVWGAKTDAYTGRGRSFSGDYTNADQALVFNWDSVGEPGSALYCSDTDLLSGVSYYITNVNSGLSLDLPYGELTAGTNIQQWEFNGSFAQQWRIIAEEDGWCRIASLGDESMVIAVAEDSAADAVNVELQKYTGADNQRFKIVRSGSSYGIVSKCSGGAGGLDVFEWSKDNGGNINQFAYHEYECQLWNITPVRPAVNDGTYQFRIADTGNVWDTKTVTNQADGTVVLSSEAGGTGGGYRLTCNKDGSYTLTAEDGSSLAFILEPCIFQEQPTEPTTEETEPTTQPTTGPEPVRGDVDANGTFALADVIMMQKYLVGLSELNDYGMGDMHEDGLLNIFDLALMKHALLAT